MFSHSVDNQSWNSVITSFFRLFRVFIIIKKKLKDIFKTISFIQSRCLRVFFWSCTNSACCKKNVFTANEM